MRIELLDALRGFALLGIIQINLPGFLAGPERADVLLALGASPRDWGVWFCQTLLIQGKFYPIFAFLFGYGFQLQSQRLARAHLPARVLLSRRYTVLLVLGALHGVLVFFGDILTMYSLAGFAMLALGPARRDQLRTRAVYWLVLSLAIGTVALAGAAPAAGPPSPLAQSLATLATGPFWPAALERAQWYAGSQVVDVVMFLPQILFFTTLGAYAARCGWLSHPRWHWRVWRRAALTGVLLGAPLNLAYALCAWQLAKGHTGASYLAPLYGLLDAFVWLLSPLYVAGVVALAGQARRHRRLASGLHLVAGFGRLALTNYLTQSLLMVALLTSAGLGLASEVHFTRLAIWGLAMVALQVLASAAYLRHFRIGPFEWLWRRLTYGRGAGPFGRVAL